MRKGRVRSPFNTVDEMINSRKGRKRRMIAEACTPMTWPHTRCSEKDYRAAPATALTLFTTRVNMRTPSPSREPDRSLLN